MSDFLEKIEQPELVLTPSVDSVATEEQTSSEAAKKPGESNEDSCPEEKSPDRLDAFPTILNEINHGESNQKSTSSAKTTKGIVRHRMITGCCVTLSLAILSLSAFDLRGLIDKQGILDSSFKFTPKAKKVNQLPLQMRSDDSTFSEGLRKVSTYSDDAIGFADEDGNVVLPAIYSEAGDFHDGFAAVKFRGKKDPKSGTYPKEESEKWAFINKLGETVLPPAYTEIGQFNNGVAPVMIDGHGALINKKGETIAVDRSTSVPIQLGDFYEVSWKDFRTGVMDNTGKFVVPPIYERIEKLVQTQPTVRRFGRGYKSKNADATAFQYFKVYRSGKCGLVDNTGEQVVPIKYENIASFNKGHAVVLQNASWGLVDSDSNFIIKPKYTFVSMYDDIIATRGRAGDWKIFDSNGKLINTKVDGAITTKTSPWLWNGMAGIVVGDKCGFVNTKGEIAIKPDYDLVQHFSNGVGLALKDGTWRFVDKAGKELSPMTFSDASPFADGKADVTVTGGLYGFINASQIDSKKYETERNRNDARSGDVAGDGAS
ncbi:hypothetical protein BH10CYA1_BH10CYA1_08980 [soil metagenome]